MVVKPVSEEPPQRVVEDVEPGVQFGLRDGQRRRDPEDPAHPRQLHDVHVQSALQAGRGDLGAQRIGGFLALFVGDQFDALQETPPAHVTDLPMTLRHAGQPVAQLCAQRGGPLDEPVTGDDVEHGAGHRRGQRVRHMGGEEQETLSWQTLSISSLVSTAATGNPAPSVLDNVSRSGATPSRSNAYIVPVRPIPVWASSRINSIPR